MNVKRKITGGKILIIGWLMAALLAGCGKSDPDNYPDPTDALAATAKVAAEPTDSKALECSWKLSVDDTVKTKVKGYDFTCTLQLNATKEGGTDILGKYKGAATLTYEYNMQKGNVQGNAKGTGQDQNVSFDMVTYNVKKFTEYNATVKNGELPTLIPLGDADTMALGTLVLNGSGDSKESAGSASWSTGESQTIQTPFRIAVEGGQVVIEIPSIVPGILFKGMVTGTPIN